MLSSWPKTQPERLKLPNPLWDHIDQWCIMNRLLSNDINSNGLGLENDGAAETLERQTRKTKLGLLDLCNLIDVLEADRAYCLVAWVARSLPLALLSNRHIGGVQQEP